MDGDDGDGDQDKEEECQVVEERVCRNVQVRIRRILTLFFQRKINFFTSVVFDTGK